jgi:hypothetical protein
MFNLVGLGKKIRAGSQGRNFNEDVYNKIINAIPELKNKFSETGSDEYTYVGDMTELSNLLLFSGTSKTRNALHEREIANTRIQELNQEGINI